MSSSTERALRIFLFISLIIVLFQVAVGGITRLTGSGLSMTEWKLISGSIPPLNEADWAETFEKYKQIPQFEIVNPLMDVNEFKWIYFWEYFHRMWGRWGFLFLLGGFAWFLLRKKLNATWVRRFVILLVIYIMQGLLGWFMVKSGLSENIYVSHYRLAAHLMLALLIFCYIAWLYSELVAVKKRSMVLSSIRPMTWIIFLLLCFQIVYGAFMSGLRAAINYPSWPDYNGSLIPENMFFMKPLLKNFGENLATVQFVHRSLAYLLFVLMLIFFFRIRKQIGPVVQRYNLLIPIILVIQMVLGIVVLLSSKQGEISVLYGILHQLNGLLLFTNFLFVWFLLKKAQQLPAT